MPGAAECERCPPFSSSVMGSSRCTFEACRAENYTDGCVCPPGTTGPDGGACAACVAGTYKDATGSAGCDNCSSTKTSVAGSASCFCRANYMTTETGDCTPCMHGMISPENSATCFCPNGTALVDGTCTQIYNKGLRLSGFLQVNETNSNTSSADLDVLIKQIKSSIAYSTTGIGGSVFWMARMNAFRNWCNRKSAIVQTWSLHKKEVSYKHYW
jgi:hypothetical protein